MRAKTAGAKMSPNRPSGGDRTDTPTDILPRKCKLRSKFWWLTGFCNSHDVSHFAAFFIVVGAKTSVAESGLTFRSLRYDLFVPKAYYSLRMSSWSNNFTFRFPVIGNHSSKRVNKKLLHRVTPGVKRQRGITSRSLDTSKPNWFAERKEAKRPGEWTHDFCSLFLFLRCGNDPSAGSPTETLLRLHLPLNDEV